MKYTMYLIFMIIAVILILTIFELIVNSKKGKKKGQLRNVTICILLELFIWTFSLIMQILFQNFDISLTFFEGMASFGACFLPVSILFLGIVFGKTKIVWKWYYNFMFVIPVLSTIVMFTNDIHHLMYIKYSVSLNETIYGQ